MVSCRHTHTNGGAGYKHTVDTKLVESFGNLNFGINVEVGIGELFALAQCTFCGGRKSVVVRILGRERFQYEGEWRAVRTHTWDKSVKRKIKTYR